jgi:hypothetical protein
LWQSCFKKQAADNVFQAIGLDKAAAYVKGPLNLIEHPVMPMRT